jgi:hypothetical protein
MSESSFTPGPWVFNPLCARVDCGELSKIGGLLPVCALLWPTDERSEAETEANAHLIAAAPDLLEALEYTRAALADPIPIGKRHIALKIDAAISKALQSMGEVG